MRLLLNLLVSIAVALLPLGSMASAAHAAVHEPALSCHHGARSGPAGHAAHAHVTADAGAAGGEIASGSEHHHHVLAEQDAAVAIVLSSNGVLSSSAQPMPAAAAPSDERAAPKPAPAHCPHCGPVCHCIGICGTACGEPMTGGADLLAARESATDTLSPAVAAVPRSWSSKPWPPPPRA